MPLPSVLYVEDAENDAFFMKEAFVEAGIANPLRIVRDGQEAIDYLAGQGAFADRTAHPLPRLLMVDLKLPNKSGFEVLQWARDHADLRDLKVVVVSSSGQHLDIQLAQRIGISDYIIKPNSPRKLVEILMTFKHRWL